MLKILPSCTFLPKFHEEPIGSDHGFLMGATYFAIFYVLEIDYGQWKPNKSN
jgi:hypothetical protein